MLFENIFKYKKQSAQEVDIKQQVYPPADRNGKPVIKNAQGAEGEHKILPEYKVIFIGQENGDIIRGIQAFPGGQVKEGREQQNKKEEDKKIRDINSHSDGAICVKIRPPLCFQGGLFN
jgi:hypothetical protein